MAYKNKEKEIAWRRKYYREHREVILNRARLWNLNNPERAERNRKAFIKKNPDYWKL